MSSEGSRTTSSSSRLSQFGLYRSIDARTEEFLRLSRKRQIRQGCACAAVSTAITVTVVVTVILVYEYTVSVDSSLSQKSRKPTWHGLFNDTSPFEAKYNKAKFNIDPVTLKLLPVILKALNQNRYLDKIIEDSSSTAGSDAKVATEQDFKNNILPGGKFRANTEYKSTPVVVNKNSFKNLDYFRKIRQTKDYQRMLKYFDRMIYGNTHEPFIYPEDETTTLRTSTLASKHTTKISTATEALIFNIQNKTNNATYFFVDKKSTDSPLSFKNLLLTLNNTLLNCSHSNANKSKTSNKVKNNNENSTTAPQTIILQKTLIRPDTIAKPPSPIRSSCNCSEKVLNLLNRLVTDIKDLLPVISVYKLPCHKNKSKNSVTTTRPKTSQTTKPTTTSTTTTTNSFIDTLPKFTLYPKKRLLPKLLKPSPNLIDFIIEKDHKKSFGLENYEEDHTINNNFTTTTDSSTTIKASIQPTEVNIENGLHITSPMQNKRKKMITWSYKPVFRNNQTLNYQTTTTTKSKTLINSTSNIFDEQNYAQHESTTENFEMKRYDFKTSIEKKDFRLSPQFSVNKLDKNLFRKSGKLANYYIDEDDKNPTLPLYKSIHNNWFNSIKTEKNKILDDQIKTDLDKTNSSNFNKIHKTNFTNKLIRLYEYFNQDSKNNITEIDNLTRVAKKSEKISIVSQSKENRGNMPTPFNWINENIDDINSSTYLYNIANTTRMEVNKEKQRTTSVKYYNDKSYQDDAKPATVLLKYAIPQVTTNKIIEDEPTFENVAPEFFSDFDDLHDKTSKHEAKYSTFLQEQNKNESSGNSYHTELNSTFDYDEFSFLDEEERETPEDIVFTPATDKYRPHSRGIQIDKNLDSDKFVKSMIPKSRPTYLEIQRNDWKHDTLDYTNIDNVLEIA